MAQTFRGCQAFEMSFQFAFSDDVQIHFPYMLQGPNEGGNAFPLYEPSEIDNILASLFFGRPSVEVDEMGKIADSLRRHAKLDDLILHESRGRNEAVNLIVEPQHRVVEVHLYRVEGAGSQRAAVTALQGSMIKPPAFAALAQLAMGEKSITGT